MFNVLLDKLPDKWNDYAVDMDFQIGIQISQCMLDKELNDTERILVATGLMFPERYPQDYQQIEEALKWYLNGWNHDNIVKTKKKGYKDVEVMDFDIDQWRIYAAFKNQYGIDLNKEKLHFWVFMGLLSNLDECSFTRVVSIRDKKITSKMSREEKALIRKAQSIFRIKKEAAQDENEAEIAERQQAIEEFNRLRGKTS